MLEIKLTGCFAHFFFEFLKVLLHLLGGNFGIGPGVFDGNGDVVSFCYLHQVRVGLRRLRVALRVFRGLARRRPADAFEARLARDTERVGALSMLLAALKDAEKASGSLDDTAAIQVLTRERKKRVEAAESFREGGREDAAVKEESEVALIDAYLPAALDEAELDALIAAAIAEAGATEPKDLGSVMKILQPKTAGRADGKVVSTKVREALAARPSS